MRVSVSGTLSSDIANNGSFSVSYPNRAAPELGSSATDEGDFFGNNGHQLFINSDSMLWKTGFDLAFTVSSGITVTNKSGSPWKAGSRYTLGLEIAGKQVYGAVAGRDGGPSQPMARMAFAPVCKIRLGAPDAASAAAISASASPGAGAIVLTSVPYVMDVPRNVTLTSGGNDTGITFTVIGTDEYGAAMRETITGASGAAASGKKAFKTVTSITHTGSVAGTLTAGFGNVLGLPVFLPGLAYILKELQDGAVPTAGTPLAGVATSGGSTATSGDVRGTYTPNASPDGDKVFDLIVALPDPGDRGQAQFAG